MSEHAFECFGNVVLYFDDAVAESKNAVDEPNN